MRKWIFGCLACDIFGIIVMTLIAYNGNEVIFKLIPWIFYGRMNLLSNLILIFKFMQLKNIVCLCCPNLCLFTYLHFGYGKAHTLCAFSCRTFYLFPFSTTLQFFDKLQHPWILHYHVIGRSMHKETTSSMKWQEMCCTKKQKTTCNLWMCIV